jgi:hypothetical protein
MIEILVKQSEALYKMIDIHKYFDQTSQRDHLEELLRREYGYLQLLCEVVWIFGHHSLIV